jgi:hypothetical protein
LLTKRGTEVLLRVEKLMEQAARSVRAATGAASVTGGDATLPASNLVSAAEQKPPPAVRGN